MRQRKRAAPGVDIHHVAFVGMLLSLALVLSFFESVLAGAMALPPGVKLGLSNVVVLFAMLLLDRRDALALSVLKASFVFLTRGVMAGALSLAGGICSIAVMGLLAFSKRVSVSPRMLSVAGALAHNIGQIAAAVLLLGNGYLVYYLPILLISGMLTGMLTGTIFKTARPYLSALKQNFLRGDL